MPSGGAQWLAAGRIGRPHGLDGSFRVTRPRPELLREGALLRVGGRDALVERRAGTDERPILRVAGISTPEQAREARGTDLLCPREQAPELPGNRWWPEDLAGLSVADGTSEVGVVRRMIFLPSCEALEVERPGGGELVVPMVADAIRSIDIEGGTVQVDLAFIGEEPAGGD